MATAPKSPAQPAAAPQAPVVQDENIFNDRERNPSEWILMPDGEDTIVATNERTGRVFNGTVAEFNQKLRA